MVGGADRRPDRLATALVQAQNHYQQRSTTMSNVSVCRKILILAVGVFVVLPTLLAACFGTVVAGGMIYELFFIRGLTPEYGILLYVKLLAMTLLGWAGLVTVALLYNHFLRSSTLPAWHRRAWQGLLCGVVACIGLVGWFDTSLISRLVVFGWPLVAVVTFAGLLAAAQQREAAAPV